MQYFEYPDSENGEHEQRPSSPDTDPYTDTSMSEEHDLDLFPESGPSHRQYSRNGDVVPHPVEDPEVVEANRAAAYKHLCGNEDRDKNPSAEEGEGEVPEDGDYYFLDPETTQLYIHGSDIDPPLNSTAYSRQERLTREERRNFVLRPESDLILTEAGRDTDAAGCKNARGRYHSPTPAPYHPQPSIQAPNSQKAKMVLVYMVIYTLTAHFPAHQLQIQISLTTRIILRPVNLQVPHPHRPKTHSSARLQKR
ncbi:hypothetical protein BDV96DRAFT_656200 [Lophiotrema nucula]|uniref:Uncharacterized protein n=1 Tax=Lophiotrema nucula TaxID=690887 RepID=A0A6A5ZSH1_9PLEO|nr:hypothetical protein BDV96DRAFT_656200 [Lophiotrema nucula]